MIVEARVGLIMSSILENGYSGPPVLVESSRRVILDGHHRYEALRRLGARLVPALVIDYWRGPVRLSSWRPGFKVARSMVVERAVRGQLFPPKTTRHILQRPLPSVRIPLSLLGVEER